MFYEILVSLCKQHGLTVTALARTLGIAKGSPSNWQRGASPNSDVVVRIAQYFGVSTDYLLGLDAVPSRSSSFSCTPDELRLIDALRSADPRARAAASASVYAILGALGGETPPDEGL